MERKRSEPLIEPQEEEFLTIRSLNYKKGDLIMKEGDYGVSIYRIISGKVGIYTDHPGSGRNDG